MQCRKTKTSRILLDYLAACTKPLTTRLMQSRMTRRSTARQRSDDRQIGDCISWSLGCLSSMVMLSVFTSQTDLISLLILFFFLLGRPLKKSLMFRRFKRGRGEIWQDCSSSKIVNTHRLSTDGVGFLIWRHNFKMAAKTTFHAERCCHLLNAHPVYTRRSIAAFRQLPIYSRPTFAQRYSPDSITSNCSFILEA